MAINRGFGRGKEEEGENLSFFKIFQSADLSSECMRALPYKFMTRISPEDFSNKMVIRAQWGSSWELEVSNNPRFYYMEKRGWNKFVSDNLLGDSEFVTFTHTGKMCFSVRIYDLNSKEIGIPRELPKIAPSSGIKEEQGETSYTDVKKEVGGAELKVRKKKAEKPIIFEKKKIMKKCFPEYKFTIGKTYLRFMPIPRRFVEEYMLSQGKMFTIRHPNRNGSWKVGCLVRKNSVKFSKGWSKMAQEYPLLVGDTCTLKLIKPTEFLLLVSKKIKEEIIVID